MSLKIAVPKERAPFEKRVAISPDTVKKYIALGCTVVIESGAGVDSAMTDDAFREAGAEIVPDSKTAFSGAQVVLCVQPPDMSLIEKGTCVIGILSPYRNADLIQDAAKRGIDLFAMELVPRITRAQAMDVLSSQSNLAGYKAVLDAATIYPRAFAMMMTAAGTVPPARVFVMGAGVAGLQAIATARRLGAIVSATDVRPAVKEQVLSLGANFVAVEDEEFKQAETAGGYAKEMSAAYREKQAELVAQTIAKQDIVITTALIPGRPAPRLITDSMVASMKAGSVIVDLAVESGGNVEGSEIEEIVVRHGVSIVGYGNVPARIAAAASALYARNLLSLMGLIVDKETASLKIDWEDDILKGVVLTRGGEPVHPAFSTPDKPKPKAKPKQPASGPEQADSDTSDKGA